MLHAVFAFVFNRQSVSLIKFILTRDVKGNNLLTGNFPPEVTILSNSLVTLDLFNNLVWNPGDEFNAFLGRLTNLGKLHSKEN